jgi:hypothetical protein
MQSRTQVRVESSASGEKEMREVCNIFKKNKKGGKNIK